VVGGAEPRPNLWYAFRVTPVRPYSATEAIGPAIARTKWFLFQPFHWGRFLKLALVSCLAEGGMSSCNFNRSLPSGNNGGAHTPFHWPTDHMPHIPPLPAMAAIFGFMLVAMLIVIPVGIFISYLLIRLRFSYFDCVLRGRDRIGEAWSRYHRQAMRYLGLSLMIGVCFWVLIGVLAYQGYQHFQPLLQRLGTDNPPEFMDFLPLIAAAFSSLMLIGIAAALIHIAMSNFVLPHMALEDASIGEALADVWDDVRMEPLQFFLFIVLRFLVALVGGIAGAIAIGIPFVILVLIGVVVVLLLKLASTALAIFLGVPAGILLLGLLILAFIGLAGTIGTFRRNYALLFYAGRYPAMAEILWPPPPPVPSAPVAAEPQVG